MISYILVAAVGLWLAFFASMKFITPAHSQEAPHNGDLPPEFMQEVEKSQVPAPPPQPAAPKAGQPAQPAQTPPPSNQPIPVGDEVTAGANAGGSGILNEENYVYDPTGKRDPFKPYKNFRPTVDVGNQRITTVLEPLQKYELEKLLIVGILWDVKTPRALLKDPDGAVHTVVRNTKIGRNEGIVAAIREGEIVVIETVYIDGNPKKETKIMEFRR
jgi:Tfp pilus assembly protein PilP